MPSSRGVKDDGRYSGTNGRKPKLRLAPQSVSRMKERVRELSRRNRGISLQRMVTELNGFLRGWLGYFQLIETPSVLEQLDRWLHRLLRCFLLKQWKVGRGRRRALRRLSVQDAWMITGSRKGPWRLSHTKHVSYGLPNRYFTQQGLLDLRQQWQMLAEMT